MNFKVATLGERAAKRKIVEDFNEAMRMGFTTDDLPKGPDGKTLQGFRTNMMRVPYANYRRATEFFKGPQGRNIIAKKKAEFENFRKKLRADRIKDPLRTKTFTVREGGKDGVSTTFREPIKDYTVGQEIVSNLGAANRGSGMTSSRKIGNQSAFDLAREYGQRSVLIGESAPNPAPRVLSGGVMISGRPTSTAINLNPEANIDFSRRLV